MFGMGIQVNAQSCSPDPLYADSTFGIWPDTNQNLPCGLPNVYYETDLQFKMPTEANQVDDTYPPGVGINWIRLDNVSGLPSGISFTTNASSSTPANQWNGGDQGCALLLGVAAAGTYDVTIEVTGEINLSGLTSEVPLSFGGYKLILDPGCDTTVVVNIETLEMNLLNNTPNPFSSITNIQYQLPANEIVELCVFDLLGNKVYNEMFQGKTGDNSIEFNAGTLSKGIYVYQLATSSDRVSGKMILSK
jgi:hypothetical protein